MNKELLLQCEPLIRSISNQFYGVEKEDLLQAGRVGLQEAYNHFDKNSNTKFSSFAYRWIYGEMYNLVVNNKSIKQNRDTLRLVKKIEQAKLYLTQSMKKEPSLQEISNFLEIDENLLINAYLSTKEILSLDKETDDNNLYNTTIFEEDNDTRIDLLNGINNLLQEEQDIIKYRYYNDLTQEQTARKLGISQVKVSRYEQKSLKKLKKYLTTE